MGIENKPYVGFPITPHCCFECSYCKDGGESGREAELLSENFVVETASMAYDLGTRKFRLTGGEPFMHPELGDILYRLSEFNGVDITVNTTGIPLIDRQGILSSTPPNVSFVVPWLKMCIILPINHWLIKPVTLVISGKIISITLFHSVKNITARSMMGRSMSRVL